MIQPSLYRDLGSHINPAYPEVQIGLDHLWILENQRTLIRSNGFLEVPQSIMTFTSQGFHHRDVLVGLKTGLLGFVQIKQGLLRLVQLVLTLSNRVKSEELRFFT